LLARALHHARQRGAIVLLTNWQNLAHAELECAETFFLTIAHSIVDQLHLDAIPEEAFEPRHSAATNFERFLRRSVLPTIDKPIVWGIDEADRLFPCAFRDDVFGRFRSWHNERALDPNGPWQQVSFLMAYSTEASLFIKNKNRSPFNVGTHITLRDLTLPQVSDLNVRYGSPASSDETTKIHHLVGGHPYLTQRIFQVLQHGQEDFARIEAQADQENGHFSDHLDRMRFALLLDGELTEAVRRWLRREALPSLHDFARLCAAGVTVGNAPSDMQPRCPLYRRYLIRNLL
jgi:hypothetical protein